MSRYAAYLSYSHADARWAEWLQKKLEGFRVPGRLVGASGEHGPLPARIAPIFRDRDELASASDLGARISGAIEDSEALIVLCSPSAAQSHWVNEEIRRFRRTPRGHRIHCVLVPGAGAVAGAFPPALMEALDGGTASAEPIAADLDDHGDGKILALQKLIAGLIGIGLDDLRQREAQRRQRRLAWITGGSLAGMGIAVLLATQAHLARNDAQRRQAQAEDLLGFMLDDLRPKLERVGRLDLLDDVGDKALAYFDTLPARDLTDTALSQQARALTQIGQVRLEQGRHQDALAAFNGAHVRAAELFQRAPGDGARLFDLAQAEYWLGAVAWRQHDLDVAERWLLSYRDRSIVLAAMDPTRFDWQREVAYGHHNIAVLDVGRGRDEAAAAAFEQELALYRQWLPEHPDDTLLRFEAANVASWLGSTQERLGRLDAAEAHFAEADQGHAANQAQEPEVKAWIDNRTDTSVLLAQLQLRRGRFDAARAILRRTVADSAMLTRHDPDNAAWQRSHGNALLALASAELACGVDPVATSLVDEARPILAKALSDSPEEELAVTYFVRASLLDAELALRSDRAEDATAALQRALGPMEAALSRTPSDNVKALAARQAELEAVLLALRGDDAGARQRRAGALAMLLDGGPEGPRPVFLEQIATLQRALGDAATASATEARFEAIGGRKLRAPAQCHDDSAGSPATTRNAP